MEYDYSFSPFRMTVENVDSSEDGLERDRLEPKEITKLNFDEGCEFYSLKVPKGFDIKKLKVSLKSPWLNKTLIAF